MRVVKALVLFMGVLIVIGIGLVAYGLSLDKKAKDQDGASGVQTPSVPVAGSEPTSEVAPNPTALSIPAFGDIKIKIEPGELLVGYTLQGTQAILHIENPDGMGARLVIVSLVDKKVIGRVLLEATGQ
ncbi:MULTISPECIES: hypothetical protein [Thalassospira]|nr:MULTISPECIES: hypothetical protein [Thalassospira]MDG4721065.1 hypothetical protein [Thalassospira sp. FZY0004]